MKHIKSVSLFILRWGIWWLLFAIGLIQRLLGAIGVGLAFLYIKSTGGMVYEIQEGEDVEDARERLRDAIRKAAESANDKPKDRSD